MSILGADTQAQDIILKKHKKNRSRLNHVSNITGWLAEVATLQGQLTGLTTLIGTLVQDKQDELNLDPLVVRIRAIANADIVRINKKISGARENIITLNTTVNADADFDNTEKQEFTDALGV